MITIIFKCFDALTVLILLYKKYQTKRPVHKLVYCLLSVVDQESFFPVIINDLFNDFITDRFHFVVVKSDKWHKRFLVLNTYHNLNELTRMFH